MGFSLLYRHDSKDGKKKPRQNFSISVDLTRRHYQLLGEAKGTVKDINGINFAFVNIKGTLMQI